MLVIHYRTKDLEKLIAMWWHWSTAWVHYWAVSDLSVGARARYPCCAWIVRRPSSSLFDKTLIVGDQRNPLSVLGI